MQNYTEEILIPNEAMEEGHLRNLMDEFEKLFMSNPRLNISYVSKGICPSSFVDES